MDDIVKELKALSAIPDDVLDNVPCPDAFDIAERKLSRACILCGAGKEEGKKVYDHEDDCLIKLSQSIVTRDGFTIMTRFPTYYVAGIHPDKPIVVINNIKTRRLLMDNGKSIPDPETPDDYQVKYCPKFMIDNDKGRIKKEYI